MLAFAFSMTRRAGVRNSGSLPMKPSMTSISRVLMYSFCSVETRSNSARLMVWSECSSGRSVAMKVDSLERETTFVATLTFPNSVLRQFGICSVYFRSSSADGFQITAFGSTGSVFALAGLETPRGTVETAGVLERISVMKILDFVELMFSAGDAREVQILHYANERSACLHAHRPPHPHHEGLSGPDPGMPRPPR